METPTKVSIWSFAIPILFVLLLWVIFALDLMFQLHLNRFSLQPRNFEALYGIFTFPLLHGDLSHIFGNTISVLALLIGVRYYFPTIFSNVFVLSYILPGIITWFIGRPHFHLGASGMIFALFTFLFISGIIRSNRYLLAISLLVVFLYGGQLWYMFPIEEGISWEGHLSGSITGVIMSFIFRNVKPTERIKEKEYFVNEEDNPLIGDLWKMDDSFQNEQEKPTIVYHIKNDKE